MSNLTNTFNRLEDLSKSYEEERKDESGMIDLSVACELADAVPFLIKEIRERDEKINELASDSNLLSHLEAAGVEEWTGWDKAIAAQADEEEKEEDE